MPRSSETIVERRTRLLKLEGDGFSRSEIVKTLSGEFQVSERTINYDFQKRNAWQPKLTSLTDRKQAFHSVLNRFQQIYQRASFTYQQSRNESVKVAALRVMMEALTHISELMNLKSCREENDVDCYLVQWKVAEDKGAEDLKETLRENEHWNKWVEENCTLEEKERIRDFTRLWIRYYHTINPEREALH